MACGLNSEISDCLHAMQAVARMAAAQGDRHAAYVADWMDEMFLACNGQGSRHECLDTAGDDQGPDVTESGTIG